MSAPEQILELTVPLSPLLRPGENRPRPTNRLRPQDSLDLKHLRAELAPSTLTTLSVGGRPWSVVSVFSPYTPDLHVMLLEASVDRYLPAPEKLDPQEGEALMALWAELAGLLAERESCARLCVGYNWSPRAWGEIEERGGFQSLPTKWHPMFWSWPPMPERGASTDFGRWIEFDGLPKSARRVMGQNQYAQLLSEALRQRIDARLLAAGAERVASGWRSDAMGLQAVIQAGSLRELFGRPGWFEQFLRPVAEATAAALRDMTESTTGMRFAEYDRRLTATEHGLLSPAEQRWLRQPPEVRPYPQAAAAWSERELPAELLPQVFAAVQARSLQTGPPEDWWRKGFGYALVLTEDRNLRSVALRLLPGVYVGPGGVVEAHRIVLRRPEDRQLERVEISRRSDELWSLAASLERRFPPAG